MAGIAACDKQPARPALKIKSGQPFPPLNLRDRDDKSVQFKLRPHTVSLINVWATWCGPCRHEMPSLQRLSDILRQKDPSAYQVVGISVDSDPLLMREYLIDKNINFANYRDADMQAANQVLGVRAFPSTYIVDAEGRVVEVVEAWRYWDEPQVVQRLVELAEKARGRGPRQ